MGYLPKPGVGFELIEFRSNGRDVQGGIFSPDPRLFKPLATAIVLVHGVESYWYSAPTMFTGLPVRRSWLYGLGLQRRSLRRYVSHLGI